jgi:DNA-binding LacI/PurR family transcriptional regulator
MACITTTDEALDTHLCPSDTLRSHHSITIPEQVSIIGYDDIVMAPYTVPALTTISQSGYRMGQQTTHLLIKMIEQELVSEVMVDEVIVPTLVVRESTEIPPTL